MKLTMPMTKSSGVSMRSRPPQNDASRLMATTVKGTVMERVPTAKTSPRKGLMPLTYMWWPHTAMLRAATIQSEMTEAR